MLKKLFKNQTNKTSIQLFRYTFVGGTAFIVDFISLYILTDFFGVYYLTSAALAFLLGLIVNYVLSIKWVFNRRTVKKKWFEFAIFLIIGVIGLALNQFFIWFFTEEIHSYYLLSKIFATLLTYLWNFFVRKFTLFR